MQDTIKPPDASQARVTKSYKPLVFLPKSAENPIRLIFLYEPKPLARPGGLPLIGADWLNHFYRDQLDDLEPGVSLDNYPASVIAECGYKRSVAGRITKHFEIRRGSIIVPSRDALGRVSGLYSISAGTWITAPQPHCVNLIRRHYKREIELHPTIVSADVAALEQNVAAICLNGVDVRQISQRIIGANPEIVYAQDRRAA